MNYALDRIQWRCYYCGDGGGWFQFSLIFYLFSCLDRLKKHRWICLNYKLYWLLFSNLCVCVCVCLGDKNPPYSHHKANYVQNSHSFHRTHSYLKHKKSSRFLIGADRKTVETATHNEPKAWTLKSQINKLLELITSISDFQRENRWSHCYALHDHDVGVVVGNWISAGFDATAFHILHWVCACDTYDLRDRTFGRTANHVYRMELSVWFWHVYYLWHLCASN